MMDVTRRLLIDAGLSAGMRVLDIGCGRGDVSLLAAELVGERGRVVGVDRDAPVLEVARERVAQLGLQNVTFVRADLTDLSSIRDAFDAVIGRRVLMYQADVVATLTRVADVLVPGGLVAFQEHDSSAMPVCATAMPLHERVSRWIWETVSREGADIQMGLHLRQALVSAGFQIQGVRAEATVITPEQPHMVAEIIRIILPRIIEARVATAEEIDIETLDACLTAEREAAGGACIWEMIFGAWARKPA